VGLRDWRLRIDDCGLVSRQDSGGLTLNNVALPIINLQSPIAQTHPLPQVVLTWPAQLLPHENEKATQTSQYLIQLFADKVENLFSSAKVAGQLCEINFLRQGGSASEHFSNAHGSSLPRCASVQNVVRSSGFPATFLTDGY
jgi:hypothetical protein